MGYKKRYRKRSKRSKRSRKFSKKRSKKRKREKIYVIPDGGCSNKMRALMGWAEVAKNQDKNLEIYWDYYDEAGNEACKGSWEDVYEIPEGVRILHRRKWDKDYITDYRTSQEIMKEYGVPIRERFECEYLVPNERVYKDVEKFLKRGYDITDSIAVHIRRTDFFPEYMLSDAQVKSLLKKLSKKGKKIFLLTDDIKVQKIAKKLLGSQVYWYKDLKPSDDFRPTTFYDSSIEQILASLAKEFVPQYYSSFSKKIEEMRKCH